ncbi:MAG TPA: hypothetical protein VMB77_05285, partial [Syntrophales bacterium]|nr:hypothetical protein [Syntrophales bacterium]
MKRSTFRLLVLLAAIGMLLIPAWAGADFSETFDSGTANWLAPTVNDGGGQTYPAATWVNVGGVGNSGYIKGAVTASSDRLYGLQAPFRTDPSTYGLFQDLTGKTLSVYYNNLSGSGVTGPKNMTVRFYIGMYDGNKLDYFVTTDAYSWNPNQAAGWNKYQVAVQEA